MQSAELSESLSDFAISRDFQAITNKILQMTPPACKSLSDFFKIKRFRGNAWKCKKHKFFVGILTFPPLDPVVGGMGLDGVRPGGVGWEGRYAEANHRNVRIPNGLQAISVRARLRWRAPQGS